MADMFDKATRSRIMAAVRTSRTAPEILLSDLLQAEGLRPRWQAKELPGSPDLVFDRIRLAIFVDGDFWHGRQWFECGLAPVQNRNFWIAKFNTNRRRDRMADARLRWRGCSVLRLWASDVKRDPTGTVARVRERISRRRKTSAITSLRVRHRNASARSTHNAANSRKRRGRKSDGRR